MAEFFTFRTPVNVAKPVPAERRFPQCAGWGQPLTGARSRGAGDPGSPSVCGSESMLTELEHGKSDLHTLMSL